jgi:hypothetical protein
LSTPAVGCFRRRHKENGAEDKRLNKIKNTAGEWPKQKKKKKKKKAAEGITTLESGNGDVGLYINPNLFKSGKLQFACLCEKLKGQGRPWKTLSRFNTAKSKKGTTWPTPAVGIPAGRPDGQTDRQTAEERYFCL